jgi:hypothetical protein
MALIVGSPNLFAQCGSDVHGSVVYCCDLEVFLSDEWSPVSGDLSQYYENCSDFVPECGGVVVFAGKSRSCLIASLSTPEMRKQLDQISQSMPLLVASCTNDLVAYLPDQAEIPDKKEFRLRPRRLVLTARGGE